MSTIKRIALTACVVASVGAPASHAFAIGGDPAAGPASPTFVLPPDYVQITDDTGSITVAVPNTWTDISTLPFTDQAGNVNPRITAATNYQVFHDTFDAPGVEYVSLPFNPDQQGLMTSFGITSGCQNTETQPYNDGAFVGLHGIWTNCGTTGLPEWHQLVVAPADNSRTLILQIQITSQAEAPILQNILDSFNTASGVPPVTTVAGVPTSGGVPTVPTPTAVVPTAPVPTVPVPTVPTPTVGVPTVPTPTVGVPTVPTPTVGVPTVPTPTVGVPTVPTPTVGVPTVPTSIGAVPPGFVQLVDATGALTLMVPTAWSDVDTAPFVLDDGTQVPQIFASTDRAQWESSFTVPGVRLRQISFLADSRSAATELAFDPGTCPTQTVEPFTNGRFSGHIARHAGCGSAGQTAYDVIVASPADQSVTYLLEIQTTGPADQAAAATAIASFGPNTGGAVTTPTVVAGTAVPGPTVPVPPSSSPVATIPTPATAPGG